MNEYRFENLKVGQFESFCYEVTQDKVDLFKKLTGDTNPLHVDKDFALSHNFKDKVVYGMLTASLISTLGGIYIPGKYCIIQQVKIKFSKPVFVGDKLFVKGTVSELFDSVKLCEIKVEIINQYKKKVLKGLLEVGFTE